MSKNTKFGAQIGRIVGEILEYDVQLDGQTWCSTLRLHIEYDITTPLERGRIVNLQGLRSWVPITYEKLSQNCFRCGRISHGNIKAVCTSEGDQGNDDQFETWLSAEQSRPKVCRELKRGIESKFEACPCPTNVAQEAVPSSCLSSSFIPIKDNGEQDANVALIDYSNDSKPKLRLAPRVEPSEMNVFQFQDESKVVDQKKPKSLKETSDLVESHELELDERLD